MLSIVIPTNHDKIEPILNTFSDAISLGGVEVIIVDSKDNLASYISSPSILLMKEVVRCVSVASNSNRGQKLQVGIDASRGEVILLHHPRSVIDPAGVVWLHKKAAAVSDACWWGGFTHKFDHAHWLLQFTSYYSNWIRPRFSRILYLDHCIFFSRAALTRDIPHVAIFEDTELSKILRESCADGPLIAPYISLTSAIRFSTNGVIYQAALNQWMKLLYHVGATNHLMNNQYERGLGLNGSIEEKVPPMCVLLLASSACDVTMLQLMPWVDSNSTRRAWHEEQRRENEQLRLQQQPVLNL